MVTHKFLFGDRVKAAAWLPFARSKLRLLRKIGLHSNKYNPNGDTLIQVEWRGNQEYIRIWVKGGPELFSRGNDGAGVVNVRGAKNARMDFLPKGPLFTQAAPYVFDLVHAGGRQALVVSRDSAVTGSPYTLYNNTLHLSSDAAVSEKALLTYQGVGSGPVYCGLVRDKNHKVTGRRFLLIPDDGSGTWVAKVSDDTGATWNDYPLPELYGPGNMLLGSDPSFIGGDTLLVMAMPPAPDPNNLPRILRSQDGGRTWAAQTAPSQSSLFANTSFAGSIKFLPLGGGTVMAIGNDGVQTICATSTDNGLTFTTGTAVIGTPNNVTTPKIAGPGTAMFGAVDPSTGEFVIIVTFDGGLNWGQSLPVVAGAPTSYFGEPMVLATNKDPYKTQLGLRVFDGVYSLYYSQDFGVSWQRGGTISNNTNPPAAGSTDFYYVHLLGTMSRPAPANIGYPSLYNNP